MFGNVKYCILVKLDQDTLMTLSQVKGISIEDQEGNNRSCEFIKLYWANCLWSRIQIMKGYECGSIRLVEWNTSSFTP